VLGHNGRSTKAGGGLAILALSVVRCHAEDTTEVADSFCGVAERKSSLRWLATEGGGGWRRDMAPLELIGG
jgi:hypothetical protein